MPAARNLFPPGTKDPNEDSVIPVTQPYLDAASLQGLLEHLHVAALVVVGINNLGMKGPDRFGRFIRRHREREIHWNESDLDILERAHFGDALRIAGDIESHG